jgi:ubiquinone/menaquinone biosynthesis C-methylase UbiE
MSIPSPAKGWCCEVSDAGTGHKVRGDHWERWLFERRGSRIYDWWSGLVGRRLHRRVAADVAAAAGPGAAVLDVGTGPGRLVMQIARRRPDLTVSGVDLSPDMIDLAQRHAQRSGLAERIALRAGDVAALPYPDRSFDLIVWLCGASACASFRAMPR